MRTKKQIIEELAEIHEFLLKGIPDQDINLMLSVLSTLTTYLASTAGLVAESGVLYNRAKVVAYYALELRFKEVGKKMSPMLAKDFISGQCGDDEYAYEFAQRINSAVTHTIDALRTSVSAEKQLLSNLR